jgi:hypothetical protein
MTFQPSGTIYLLANVQLDNTYRNTFDFASSSQQYTFFHAKAAKTVSSGYFYLRETDSIKVPYKYDEIFNVSYVMYRNSTTGKWIYCFVTKKRYVSEAATELFIETDVMQTFQFDYSLKSSFVEREHQDRWSISGKPIFNTIEENLDYGDEYIKESEQIVDPYSGMLFFLVVATDALEANPTAPEPIQSAPTPFFYYIVPYKDGVSTITSGSTPVMSAQDLCRLLAENQTIVSVCYIPYIPMGVTVSGSDVSISGTSIVTYSYNGGQSSIGMIKINGSATAGQGKKKLFTMDKYTGIQFPSNYSKGANRSYLYESKLMTYPYSFYQVADFQCEPLTIKTEYVNSDTIDLWVTQIISHNPKTKYFVEHYKGETDGKRNNMINATVNDLPLKSDAYKNYILSNKASSISGIAMNAVGGAAAIGVGIATGGLALPMVAGVAVGNVSNIVAEMAKRKDLQAVPDSVRNFGNNIAFDIADGNTVVRIVRYGISEKYKKLLSDYWYAYGYKCNEVKIPDLKSRRNFNYIKTINANITGNFDVSDLAKMKSIFDNGVTFFHYNASDDTGTADYTPLKNAYVKENVEKKIYVNLYGNDGAGDNSNPNSSNDNGGEVDNSYSDPWTKTDLTVTFFGKNGSNCPMEMDSVSYGVSSWNYFMAFYNETKLWILLTKEPNGIVINEASTTFEEAIQAYGITPPPTDSYTHKAVYDITASNILAVLMSTNTIYYDDAANGIQNNECIITYGGNNAMYFYNKSSKACTSSSFNQSANGFNTGNTAAVFDDTYKAHIKYLSDPLTSYRNGISGAAGTVQAEPSTAPKRVMPYALMMVYDPANGGTHTLSSDGQLDLESTFYLDKLAWWFNADFIIDEQEYDANCDLKLLRNEDEVDLKTGIITHKNGTKIMFNGLDLPT